MLLTTESKTSVANMYLKIYILKKSLKIERCLFGPKNNPFSETVIKHLLSEERRIYLIECFLSKW